MNKRVRMELVNLITSDDYEYEGLLWAPSADRSLRIGAILVHGWSYWYDPRVRTRRFCGTHLAAVASSLATLGATALFTTNRGFHAPEFFDDCSLDFAASINFLVANGCEEIILIGHSLGGAKCAYYAGEIGHPLLRGVVLISAIPTSYNFETPEKMALLEQARSMLVLGGEHRIITCQEGKTVSLHEPAMLLRSFNDAYRGTTLEAVSKITVPLLSIAAEREWSWFQVVTKGIKDAAIHSSSVDAEILPGARDHYYSSCEDSLAQRICAWVQKLFPKRQEVR